MAEIRPDRGVDEIIADFAAGDIPWPGGKLLFDWWQSARGERPFPARADFRPSIMGRHLSSMVLHDVGPQDSPDFRIRLVGTAVVDFLGHDPTGRPLSDLPNSTPLRARYCWVLEHKAPYLCRDLPLAWASRNYLSYSTLVMPLGETDERVDMLIANVGLRRS